jgi:hypothetical protein
MTDFIGSIFAMILILFLCSPIILAVYMWTASKIDIDNDGKEDLPNRWNN